MEQLSVMKPKVVPHRKKVEWGVSLICAPHPSPPSISLHQSSTRLTVPLFRLCQVEDVNVRYIRIFYRRGSPARGSESFLSLCLGMPELVVI